MSDGWSANPSSRPPGLAWIQPDKALTVWHPARGEVTAAPSGRVVFEELTQRQRGAQNPWTTTGNGYLALRLEESLVLYNWQTRYYLLDSRTLITDDDIRHSFASHAQRFGHSDQTAEVVFEYPALTKWRIDDIGKLRIGEIRGDWFPATVGAVARFIHTSALAAPLFAAAAMRVKAKHAFYLDGVLLHISQLSIETSSALVGWSIERLQHALQLKVISHEGSGGSTLFPPSDLCLRHGDKLTVVAGLEELVKLDELGRSGL